MQSADYEGRIRIRHHDDETLEVQITDAEVEVTELYAGDDEYCSENDDDGQSETDGDGQSTDTPPLRTVFGFLFIFICSLLIVLCLGGPVPFASAVLGGIIGMITKSKFTELEW